MLQFIIILAAFAAMMVGNPVRLVELRAFQVSGGLNEIRVEWSVQNETETVRYIVRRKMQRDADFVPVSEIDARGQGSYTFTDRNVYKASESVEQVFYAVVAVQKDGSRELLGQTSVLYTASTVRRTWGSIKAMFQ
jgi:hypothetical protein